MVASDARMLFQFEYLVTVVHSENPPRGGLARSVDIGMSAFPANRIQFRFSSPSGQKRQSVALRPRFESNAKWMTNAPFGA
jgi:hypothetical protein